MNLQMIIYRNQKIYFTARKRGHTVEQINIRRLSPYYQNQTHSNDLYNEEALAVINLPPVSNKAEAEKMKSWYIQAFTDANLGTVLNVR